MTVAVDGAAWYASLIVMIFCRYGASLFLNAFFQHLPLFTFLFFLWMLIFYIAGLYQQTVFRGAGHLFRAFLPVLVIGSLTSLAIFYVFEPLSALSPKTNFVIFILIFGLFDLIFRVFFLRFLVRSGVRTSVLFFGLSDEITSLDAYLKENPHAGYEPRVAGKASELWPLVPRPDVLVIASETLRRDKEVQRMVYERFLPAQIFFTDSISFYESIFDKVPVGELKEHWFIEHIVPRSRLYHSLERALDAVLAVFAFVLFLPFMAVIGTLVKCTSRGPMLYAQTRIGQAGQPFTLYKFRTMRIDAEKNGPQWASKKDPRTTIIGRALRATHLDELPQLFNILKGDLSFVGPRPERPEFVSELRKSIPHYDVRHIVKPGLTGWAQIHYRYGASVADAAEKLQYDVYYIKHRSLGLDILIILKTLKLFFTEL